MEIVLPQFDPRLLVRIAFRCWLVLGTLCVLLLPSARGFDPLLGALPLWLIALPALSLVVGRVKIKRL